MGVSDIFSTSTNENGMVLLNKGISYGRYDLIDTPIFWGDTPKLHHIWVYQSQDLSFGGYKIEVVDRVSFAVHSSVEAIEALTLVESSEVLS